MKVRQKLSCLCPTVQFGNVTLESEIELDSVADAEYIKELSLVCGVETCNTYLQMDQLVRKLNIEALKEQREALDELPREFFSKRVS